MYIIYFTGQIDQRMKRQAWQDSSTVDPGNQGASCSSYPDSQGPSSSSTAYRRGYLKGTGIMSSTGPDHLRTNSSSISVQSIAEQTFHADDTTAKNLKIEKDDVKAEREKNGFLGIANTERRHDFGYGEVNKLPEKDNLSVEHFQKAHRVRVQSKRTISSHLTTQTSTFDSHQEMTSPNRKSNKEINQQVSQKKSLPFWMKKSYKTVSYYLLSYVIVYLPSIVYIMVMVCDPSIKEDVISRGVNFLTPCVHSIVASFIYIYRVKEIGQNMKCCCKRTAQSN